MTLDCYVFCRNCYYFREELDDYLIYFELHISLILQFKKICRKIPTLKRTIPALRLIAASYLIFYLVVNNHNESFVSTERLLWFRALRWKFTLIHLQEQNLTYQCLNKNDYNREICEPYFVNYNNCKDFWVFGSRHNSWYTSEIKFFFLPSNRVVYR